jgi:Na+-translocating ferredoxin:NAD+ oxidoreductase RNF subunit RnfB
MRFGVRKRSTGLNEDNSKSEYNHVQEHGSESQCPSNLESLAANIALILPQENCGRCGYENCIELARAIAMGIEEPDVCEVAEDNVFRIIRCIKNLEMMCSEVTGLD